MVMADKSYDADAFDPRIQTAGAATGNPLRR
jgi:hypothetical protein